MRESVLDRSVGLLAAAKALKPVGHVVKVFVAHARGRKPGVSGKRDIFLRALFVDVGIVLVVSLFLDQLVPRAALAADVNQRGLLSHVARKAVRIVAEAGRVARQKAFRVLEQGVKSIRVLAAVVPGIDAAVRDHRAREVVVGEPVHQVDAVAHPLVGDAAREVLVEPEFKIELRVERPFGLGHQPFTPVGVFLADLLHLGAAAPARAVVIPYDLDLAYIPQRPALDHVVRGPWIKLAAVLRAHLDDQVSLERGVARGLRFLEHVAHGLFHVGILAGLSRQFQNGRVRVLGRGNQDRVNVLERQQVLQVFELARRPPVILLVSRRSLLAVDRPQVAHGRHLDVVLVLEPPGDPVELGAAIADPDVPERNAVVRAYDPAVGKGGAAQDSGASGDRRALIQKRSPIDFLGFVAHDASRTRLISAVQSTTSPEAREPRPRRLPTVNRRAQSAWVKTLSGFCCP